jgi:hypothetical protein
VGIIVKSRQAMRVLWRHIQENIAMGRNMFGN